MAAIFTTGTLCQSNFKTSSAAPIVCTGSISTQEMEALYALYDSTDGVNWLNQIDNNFSQYWYFPASLDAPCRESWYGLVCVPVLAVEGVNCAIGTISLGANNLLGFIPSQIANLLSLGTLAMPGNYLTGAISSVLSELGTLTALTTLELADNLLYDSLSAGISNMSTLLEFEIYGNYVSGEIPPAIGQLTRLHILNIGENFLSGSLVSEVGGLVQLTQLLIYTNLLSDSIPSEIVELSRVFTFYFNGNQFSALPDSIRGMAGLEYLHGYDNAIQQLPSDIFKLPLLLLLYMEDNELFGSLPDSVTASPLKFLSLADNSMTGSLPETLDFVDLYLGNNMFTGPLPSSLYTTKSDLNVFSVAYNMLTGSLISLSFSDVTGYDCYLQDNLLSGSIPPGLAEAVITLDLSNNSLIGPFPSIFCATNLVETVYIANNFLTGPLIFPSGGCQLSTLDLTNNSMNGTIAGDIGALNTCLLAGNRFSGPLDLVCAGEPSTAALSNLQLGSNLLTGNLRWLSCLTNLTVLGIENNSFTGNIEAMANLTTIQEIIIDSNRLTGTLPSFISTFAQLKAIIVAGNRFIGNPDGIFDPDTQTALTAVDFSDNSFSGNLPSIVFTLPALESFASVKTCFSGSIPSTVCLATALKILLMDGTTSGTACQTGFALNSLFMADAYVSTKGPLTGGIPACIWTDLPQLTSVHLSSNGLTGSLNIPSAGSIRNLSSIVLSYNQLSGTLPPAIFSLRFETLELSNNRFKGTIDGNLQVDNATVFLANNRLSGFVPFSFSNSSANLNVLQGNLFDCSPNQPKPSRDQHASSTACGSAALNNALIAWGTIAGFLVVVGVGYYLWNFAEDGVEPSSRQIKNVLKLMKSVGSSWKSVLVGMSLTTLQLEQLYAAPAQRFKDLFLMKLTAPGSALFDYFSVLLYLLTFQGIFVVVGSALICIPTYLALKFVDNGKYSTHTYQYHWLVSSDLLSGVWPAVCLLTIWVSAMTLFVAVVGKFDIAREAWRRTHVNQPILSSNENFEATATVLLWAKGINLALVACFCFLLLNVVIISSVNAGYLFILLSGNFSVEVVVAAQTCVSLFKVVWDLMGIPTGIQCLRLRFQDSNEYDTARFMQLNFWCNALNSVVLPFIVSLFVNSLCFLDLFVPQSVINENFIYNLANRVECVTEMIPTNQSLGDDQIQPLAVSTCLSFGESQHYATEFYPPFTYSFQCGSSIITSYVPILIYSCAFRIIASFAKVLRERYPAKCTFFPHCQRIFERDGVSEISADARSSLRHGSFLSHLLVECVVLLTFGASSPPLAFITWICVLVEASVHIQEVTKFVSAACILESLSVPPDVDNSMSEVRALAGAGVWPCVHLASIYWALQLFDMVGDTNVHHPAQASWAPILACTLPLLLRGLVNGWYLRRIVLDAKVARIVSLQSVVTTNAIHVPVETSNELKRINSDGDIALTDFAQADGADVSSVAAQQSNSNFSNCPSTTALVPN
jgi:Leucine-rich repeat (LRR) protein